MAAMAPDRPPPNAADRPMASTSGGKDIPMSVTRMRNSSTARPLVAATVPITVPTVAAISSTTATADSVVRAP